MRNDKYRFILHKTSIMIDQQRANLLYPVFKRTKKKKKKSTLKLEINLYQSYKKHRIRRLNSKGLNDGRLSWNHYRPSFNVLPSANNKSIITITRRSKLSIQRERKFQGSTIYRNVVSN